MKRFRQLAAMFLAFALVIGGFFQPSVAYAEETESLTPTDLKDTAVKIDYENEQLEVTKTAGETVYYTVKWKKESHAKTVWEEAYEDSATKALIDFSNISVAKDVSIWLTTDTDKAPIEIIVKAQETALNVAFSGVAETTTNSKIKVGADWTALTAKTAGYQSFMSENPGQPWTYGFLNATIGKGDTAKVMTASEAALYLEFRKGTTGAWSDITNLDVRKYVAYGAQLSFRLKAVNNVSGSAIENLGRTSKEVKVTYTKQANAPKVSINGVTKEIKLAKNHEYRLFTSSGSSITYSSWVKVADKHMDGTKVKKVYLMDLLSATSGSAWSYDENSAGQGIQVRIAASEKGVASKVATIKLNQVTTPTVGTGAVEFSLVKSTTYDKGILVKNGSDKAIQVAAVATGTAFDLNKTKWISVTAGKTGAISGTILKLADTILYRTATIKDNTKTTTNEFVVSSKYDTYAFREQLPLTEVVDPTPTPKPGSKSITLSYSGSVGGVITKNATSTEPFKVILDNSGTSVDPFDINLTATATGFSTAQNITVQPSATLFDVGGSNTISDAEAATITIQVGKSYYRPANSREETYTITAADGTKAEFIVCYNRTASMEFDVNQDSSALGVTKQDYGTIAPMTVFVPETLVGTSVYLDVTATNFAKNNAATIAVKGEAATGISATINGTTTILASAAGEPAIKTTKLIKIDLASTAVYGSEVNYTITAANGVTIDFRIVCGKLKTLKGTLNGTTTGVTSKDTWQASKLSVKLADDYVAGTPIYIDITPTNFKVDQTCTIALKSGYSAIDGITLTTKNATIASSGKTAQVIQIDTISGYDNSWATTYRLTTTGAFLDIEIIANPTLADF